MSDDDFHDEDVNDKKPMEEDTINRELDGSREASKQYEKIMLIKNSTKLLANETIKDYLQMSDDDSHGEDVNDEEPTVDDHDEYH